MNYLYDVLALAGVLFIFAVVLVWAYQRRYPSDTSVALYRAGRTALHATGWSFRHKWTSFAWYGGLLAFAATAVSAGSIAATQGLLVTVGIQLLSWPIGAALGGLIDAVVRSRRSKSRAVVRQQ